MGIAEIFGYLASVLLALALIVNNDIKFRWINGFGSICFIIYGILISAFPIILTNSVLLSINIIYLIKIYRTDVNFELIEFKSDDDFIKSFFNYYHKDIQSYFPGATCSFQNNNDCIAFAVMRDMVIANVFIATKDQNGKAWVKINYTVPKYRDFKVGRYLFKEKRSFFSNKGINEIIYAEVSNPNHERFLNIMGFNKSNIPGKIYHLDLP